MRDDLGLIFGFACLIATVIALIFSVIIFFISESIFAFLWGVICFIVVLAIILIIYYTSTHIEEKKLQKAMIATDFSQIDKLTPYEFEEWIARFLRIAGYNANATKKSGDYGVDVIAEKGDERIAIQVKKFTKSVGIKAVQEVSSGMNYYNCNEGWVVTTALNFTQAAKNLARTQGIKLYNKNDLAIMLYELQKNQRLVS